jgi:gamma-glutamyl hercynylcysteine S-oxide synthase
MSPMLRYGVYGSRWPLGEQAVWTIVNRNEYDVEGDQIQVPVAEGMRYFDLYHGVELKPRPRADGTAVLGFSIEAKGAGPFLRPGRRRSRKAWL